MAQDIFTRFGKCKDGTIPIDVLNNAISKLHLSYDYRNPKRCVDVNFNDNENRSAYVYLYSTSIAYMVEDVLQKGKDTLTKSIDNAVQSNNGTYNVTSLGSGPGSDLVGVIQFLRSLDNQDLHSIEVNALDKYKDWEDTFSKVMSEFHDQRFKHSFQVQDFMKPLTTEVQNILKQTHLLILVKFISAIPADKFTIQRLLQVVLRYVQPGTVILLIDNSGGNHFYWARDAFLQRGPCKVIISSNDPTSKMDTYQFEIPRECEPNMPSMDPNFAMSPQKQSRIAFALLMKVNTFSQQETNDKGCVRSLNF